MVSHRGSGALNVLDRNIKVATAVQVQTAGHLLSFWAGCRNELTRFHGVY
jgi:hypothetical protein